MEMSHRVGSTENGYLLLISGHRKSYNHNHCVPCVFWWCSTSTYAADVCIYLCVNTFSSWEVTMIPFGLYFDTKVYTVPG